MAGAKDKAVLAYANAIIRYRWAVIIVSLLAAFGAISGAQHLKFTSDYRVFFSKENPQLNAFEALQAIYTKSDNILIVLKPDDGTILDNRWLSIVEEVTEEAWQIPYSIRVDSLSNFQDTIAEEDDLIVQDLFEDAMGLNGDQRQYIGDKALSEPALADRLISDDMKTTGINIILQLPDDDAIALTQAVEYAEKIAQDVRDNHEGVTVAITGLAPLSNSFPRASQLDMQTLIPVMFLVIIVALIIFLRSFVGTILTLIVTILSALAAMGIAGWSGVKLTPASAMAPIIILTIAIADCVHILVTMFHEMRKGVDRKAAVIESLRVNMQPVFLTTITTMIGFLSLNFSDAPPFNDLGNISAIGVAVAWFLAVGLLPAAVSLTPIRFKKTETERVLVIERIGEWVIGNQKKLLIGVGIAVVVVSSMISRIELDDRFVEYFDHKIPFRVDSDFVRDNMTGIYQVEFSVGTGDLESVSDPTYLRLLDGFANWLRDDPRVVHVFTMTDIMKRLNKSMHGDDETWYRLPDERELSAQYLLLYEMSLPYGLDLNSQINIDKSASRVTVTLGDVSSADMRQIAEEASQWLVDNAPEGMHAEGSGSALMFAYIGDRNIKSMLGGTALAFVLISLSLVFALRSFRLGMISLVPNIVPATMAFGVWGIVVGQVGLAASVIAATSLGLIVDATVHFLSKYVRARRERGLGLEDSLRYSFRTVGTAIWVTSAILIAGFAVLSYSSFQVNSHMGMLTALTIALALVVDFLLLPPLLLLLDKRDRDDQAPASAVGQAAE